MYKKYFSLILFWLVLLSPLSLNAVGDEETLYRDMDYDVIFDQQSVLQQKKFQEALKQEGLEKLGEIKVKQDEIKAEEPASCLIDLSFLHNNHKKPYAPHKKDDDLHQVEIDIAALQSSNERNIYLNEDMVFYQEIEPAIDEIIGTSDDLDKALVADFRNKKKKAMRTSLYQPFFNCSVDALFLWGGPYFIPIGGETASGFANFVMFNTLAENMKSFSKSFWRIFVSPGGDPVHKYEEIYAQKKRFFTKSLQDSIETKFATARKSPFELTKIFKFFDIALNLPIKSKKISLGVHSTEEEALKTLLSDYLPNTLGEDIFSDAFAHAVRFSQKANPIRTPKIIPYLEGVQGLGKTYIVNYIGGLFDLPVLEVKIASDDPSEIIGDQEKPGKILEALVSEDGRTARNAILFLDELDRVANDEKRGALLNLLLPLLEPSTTKFYSPYLGAYVDISHLFIIAAGNSSIKDAALLSRLNPHKIEKFKDTVNEEDAKKEIIHELYIIEDDVNEMDIKKMGAKAKVIWNSIIPKLTQNEEPMWNLDPENLSKDCKRDIQKAITEDPEIGLRWIEIRLIKILNNERRGVYLQ